MSEPEWSPEERRIFRHEAFIAKVLEERKKAAAEEDLNPSFLRLLESSGMTALITVVLGSLLAPIVISSIQNNRARNDQAISEYKQYLERQQEVVKNTYDLVGKMIYTSQELIDMTTPTFRVDKNVEEDQQTLKKQRAGIVEKFNSTHETWKVEEEKLGHLMSYYHYGQPVVLPAWRETQQAVNGFIQCAQKRYRDYRDDPEIEDKPVECQSETGGVKTSLDEQRDRVRTSLDKLAASIEASRRYIWQQLEVPAPLSPRLSASPLASPSP